MFKKLTLLIPLEEKAKLEKKIPIGETPLWIHWEEYVKTRELLGKSSATVLGVRDGLRMIMRHAGILTIEQANNSRDTARKLLEMKEKRNQSCSTHNTYIKNLRSYFIWLDRQEYIKENKIPKIEKPTAKRKEQLVLDREQVKKVVEHVYSRKYATKIERPRNLFLINLLRFTGARPCELLDLEIGSIRKTKNGWQICIDGKKQKGRLRYYTLPQFVMDSYLVYIQRRAIFRDHDWLFVSRTGEKWGASGINCLFKKISKEMGMHVNAYAFRRYVATQLDENGIDIKNIMRHLGHTRSSTTELYIERSGVLTKDSGECMANLADAFQ